MTGSVLSGRFAYAAPATPPGISGIAVIRMAGRSAFEIADEIFTAESSNGCAVSDMEPYTCAYGSVRDPVSAETADKVILTKFTAPHSYTGEDIVEFSCHGGIAARERILDILYSRGARPAVPGEFTRNAFLNGKLDLAQAEAVMDLISAQAARAGSEAVRQMQGRLSSRIREISSGIYSVSAKIEMMLEFPEHEDSHESMYTLLTETKMLMLQTGKLVDSFRQGRILREGFTVVIAGKPNAGKSSLMNAIAGHERSIVTDIPGTTRDTVEETAEIDGLPVRLIDTAGLRESADAVEQLGVGRARQAIGSADLVLWVIDEDQKPVEDLQDEFSELTGNVVSFNKSRFVAILSKIDIVPFEKRLEEIDRTFPELAVIPFSSVTGEGLDDIRRLIADIYNSLGSSSSEEVIITNSRHMDALRRAHAEMKMAHEGIRTGVPMDVLASVFRKAAESLAEITGDEVSEKLVDEIFTRFCVGK